MKITVVGTGYVGLVTGTCFAEMGNDVICVDIDEQKINMLNNGKIPIFEPGLEEMVIKNNKEKRLFFTTDIKSAVEESLICFIAVGTPPDEDGSADLQYVLKVAEDIATYMNDYKIIVDKSTVPIGTADLVREKVQKILDERQLNYKFDVVSNPEFLKEGKAVQDFMRPDRVVIGTDSDKVREIMNELYSAFSFKRNRIIFMDIRSAEMTKYAANAMLATRITFMNEIANLCENVKADIDKVRIGIGSDTRIGYDFLYAGIGYGGSCFPKDVKALMQIANKNKVNFLILNAVDKANEFQKMRLVEKVCQHFADDLSNKTFAVWGLSFKPLTDDMREAPSIVIINALINKGAKIQAYDPEAMKESERIFGDNPNIIYCQTNYDALKNADALLLITEWRQFREPNFDRMKKLLNQPIIFDGRNQYDPDDMKAKGFIYYGIGRGY